jgi:hypothetical protein
MNVRSRQDSGTLRILITQGELWSLTGSVVATLELAGQLQKLGHTVTIYSYAPGLPAVALFEARGLTVVQPGEEHGEAALRLGDFDFVWVHHQVLPRSFIIDLTTGNFDTIPKFIFNHMSPFDSIPLEFPYIFNLEKSLSGKSLFNSPETMRHFLGKFSWLQELNIGLYQNPAPMEYCEFGIPIISNSSETKKFLIVSNHPPTELKSALRILSAAGHVVIFRGATEEESPRLIQPQEIAECTAVISIGKTVQYCLVMGAPIYVYDHFGGPGFLNLENFSNAEFHNFSGRGFGKKTAENIARELVDFNSTDQLFQVTNLQNFRIKYNIENAISAALMNVSQPRLSAWDREYREYLTISHLFAMDLVRDANLRHLRLVQLERSHVLVEQVRDANEIARANEHSRRLELESSLKSAVGTIAELAEVIKCQGAELRKLKAGYRS